MLNSLYIKNFALIKSANIQFSPKLNILTGETGAGKSLILGAINLILGGKPKQGLILNPDEKCIVEAEFTNVKDKNVIEFLKEQEIYEGDNYFIIRREINPSGRSRAYINDTPININILKELLKNLVDLHSQDETGRLLNTNYQLKLLDNFAELQPEIKTFEEKYNHLIKLRKKLLELQEEIQRQKEREELLKAQLEDLNSLDLENINEEELETQVQQLQEAEKILQLVSELELSLYENDNSPYYLLVKARKELEKFSELFTDINDAVENLYNIENLLQESLHNLDKVRSKIDLDPEKIQIIQETYDELNRLKLKFRKNSLQDLIELKQSLEEQLSLISSNEEELETTKQEIKKSEQEIITLAIKIEKVRKEYAVILSNEVNKLLEELNLPYARFRIIVGRKSVDEEKINTISIEGKNYQLYNNGINWIEFRIQTNPGSPEGLLSEIASGGERSRIMLALKTALAKKLETEVMIFDEIDTGISGATAGKVGKVLQKLAEQRQVIVITHSPQIASRKAKHFLILKHTSEDETFTTIKELSQEERELEVARLLSGEPVSEYALKNAKELLNN